MMLRTHKQLAVIALSAAGLPMIAACTSPIKELPPWEQAEIRQSAKENESQPTAPWDKAPWDKFSAEDMVQFRKSAENGDASAQYFLGLGYANGEGVPQDYAQAVMWYSQAADRGVLLAQEALSTMYFRGRGVPQDYALAYMWINLAATHGYIGVWGLGNPSAEQRDSLVKMMTPSQIEEGQRLTREWMAAHAQKQAKPATSKSSRFSI